MAAAVDRPDFTDQPERIRMGQLFDLLIADYRFKDHKSTYDTELRVNAHPRRFFGQMKAQAIGTTVIRKYVEHRRRQEASNATVNKELSWTRRAMRLGFKHDPQLVLRVPSFEMLPVDNVREGTLEHDQYRTLRDALPVYARIALVIGCHTGIRKGEVRAIRIDKIDFKAMRVLLPGRTTKNGKPRYLPIYGDMKAEEAMEISGHKTRAVFDRYHIVSERRLKQNAEKLAEHLKAKEAELVQDASARRMERVQ
jgi:integrase